MVNHEVSDLSLLELLLNGDGVALAVPGRPDLPATIIAGVHTAGEDERGQLLEAMRSLRDHLAS